MRHRLFHPIAVPAFLISVCALGYFAFNGHAAGPASQAKHGLTGSYYVSGLFWDKDTPATGLPGSPFVQVWFDPNDFGLPRTFMNPAATRIDPQVAFGQGKGFSDKSGKTMPWWPTGFALPQGWADPSGKPWDAMSAMIWKGYIHLPKAGTYYFTTVSHGASAVYLNRARVALNGDGVLFSDAFSYAQGDVQDYVQNIASGHPEQAFSVRPRDSYVVPVPIDGPRDLPIEVQYSSWVHDWHGIDLYWVTPDSPRDASGKPIAHMVPSDAVHTEPPGEVEKPAVRSANSTISANFLYFPVEETDQWVTATIRLADKDGNPVAGKRVHISTVVNYGYADDVVQPDKPTDDQGVTTAKFRAGGDKNTHDSTIFATDVTDLVDVAQASHVSFQSVETSLFPDAFSPYYDPNIISVEPLPLSVGRPVTVKVQLLNRTKFPADVTATFLATDWNIGTGVWPEIGKVKGISLRPGEHKEVSITWTPKEAQTHQCFKVELGAHYSVQNDAGEPVLASSAVPVLNIAAADQPESKPSTSENVQRNTGPVQLPPCGQPRWGNKEVPPTIPIHAEACKPNDSERMYCEAQLNYVRQEIAPWKQKEAQDLADGNNESARFDVDSIYQLESREKALEKCASDPPDPAYRRLAVAPSDTPAGYMEAATKSWERYQTAEAEGDRDWMARHFTADKIYMKRFAQALRSAADDMQKRAESLPPDDAGTVSKIQAAQDRLLERWRRGERFTPDQLALLKQAGVSDKQATAAIEALLARNEIPPAKSLRTILLETAAEYRQSADEAEQIASSSANSGEGVKPGEPLAQTYAVGNPHDKQENVDLFIRPISTPPDWKLSVVNDESVEAAAKAALGAAQFPVQEVDAGKHYAVTLPAKAQVKVASVVIPVGEVGANTTARWAVEGKIGNELIGGMVHEMNVPYIISDLKLPPVGSVETEEVPATRGRLSRAILIEVTAGILVLGALLLFLLRRRRRQA